MHDTTSEEQANSLALDLGDEFMDLFHDDDVTEVGVNPFRPEVWADTRSRDKVETNVSLLDATVRSFLQRAAGYNDETLTADDPDLESSLPTPIWNGSRLSGAVPPAVPAPSFSIRKFEGELIPLESYVEDEIMSRRQFDRLIEAIKQYENIAIVGGTGSGKTTLLMSVLNKMGDFLKATASSPSRTLRRSTWRPPGIGSPTTPSKRTMTIGAPSPIAYIAACASPRIA